MVYLDDITMNSKNRDDHLLHLLHIFKRYRKYRISLNPKRSIFVVIEGKLFGHTISKKGIIIDPERVKSIAKLALQHNKKAMQYFFGKKNFIRKFIPYFAETIRPLQLMTKKNQ